MKSMAKVLKIWQSGNPTILLYHFLGFTEESNGEIILQEVPIVTPNGDIIVRNMSLMVNLLNIKFKKLLRFNQECTFLLRVPMAVEKVLYSEFLENYGRFIEEH
jgi:hypothetical protein